MEETIQDKTDKINTWLRYHPDWMVTLKLNAIYGCISIEVTENKETRYFNIGTNLDKRLDEVLAILETQDKIELLEKALK